MTDHASPPEPTPTPTAAFEPPVPATPSAEPEANAVPVPPSHDDEPVVEMEAAHASVDDDAISEPEAAAEEAVSDEIPTPEPVVARQDLDEEPADEDLAAHDEPMAETPAGDAESDSGEAAEGAAAAEPPQDNKKWYVVKVQSNREDTIKAAIERQVKIRGLEQYFGRIVIPVEKVVTLRGGKRVTKYVKKFAGYLMCHVEFNENILYLFRETSGVGDFVGGTLTRPPLPMTEREVLSMLADVPETDPTGKPKPVKVDIKFAKGDRVRIREGTFADMEGEVKEILEPRDAKENVKIRVEVTIWGRPANVDLEHWQIDPV